MPELRKDPILSRWVIIATDRRQAYGDPQVKGITISEKKCPFCSNKADSEIEEIFSLKDEAGNWKVKVTPSQ
jgi:UDPglucose--hexose-1-phosphate uridylyltransferase